MRKAEKEIAERVKDFRAEDPEEARKRRLKICTTCTHWSTEMMCNYSADTGELRPCAGSKCVEKGIYQKGKRKKTVRSITLL